MNSRLEVVRSDKDIEHALIQMGPMKASGPDVLSLFFTRNTGLC